MAITLLEAKVGMADKVDQKVVDAFARESLLLQYIPFDNAVSAGTGGSTLTYGYLQTTTAGTASIRAINAEYTAQEAKKTKKTADCVIFGGSFEIDRVLAKTSGAMDEVSYQLEEKSKATANTFVYKAINAVKATDGFDGLDKLLTGSANVVTASMKISDASSRNTLFQTAIDDLDLAESYMDEKPTMWLMNKKTKAWYTGCARRAGYHSQTEDAFGRKIDTINGVKVYEVGKYFNGTSSVETIPDGDIYGVVLSKDGFHAISPEGTNIIEKHLPNFNEAKAVHKGDVEMVAGVVLKSTLKAIHIKAKTTAD